MAYSCSIMHRLSKSVDPQLLQTLALERRRYRSLARGLHGMASASSAPPTPTSAAAAADQQRYENPINLKGTPLLRVCQPVG